MGESVGSVGEILAQITVGILQIAHNISPNVSLSSFTGEPLAIEEPLFTGEPLLMEELIVVELRE